ncbi:SRPBCC family protein [Zhihengliuella flava]|uniref:Uncharacterized protein YndB with AHSA1/START domain n=1 Tax=Zhihengliuella flava TaxID=1285193 RepID=A0A931GIB2_9MICC|nr:SRPBCC domain-containing protein [Zhihengliuella flava]MBG6084081.1 uncharacterized protein YndB with AHSA1/START domain [Zhihengliuella flava]
MPVTSVVTDLEALTFTVSSRVNAAPESVWRLIEDPSLLEGWWGPPGHPAEFSEHSLTPGERCRFTIFEHGVVASGWWRILEVEKHHRLIFEDGREPGQDLPRGTTQMTLSLDALPGNQPGTLVRLCVEFSSARQLDAMAEADFEETLSACVGQMDKLLLAAA